MVDPENGGSVPKNHHGLSGENVCKCIINWPTLAPVIRRENSLYRIGAFKQFISISIYMSELMGEFDNVHVLFRARPYVFAELSRLIFISNNTHVFTILNQAMLAMKQ